MSVPGRRNSLLAQAAAEPSSNLFPKWFLGAGQSKDLATRFRKHLWRILRSPFQVEWFDGLRIELYPKNEICRSIFVTGIYEPNEFHFLSSFLGSGMTVIDVGANMGLYTLFAAQRVGEQGRVVSLEPSSREYSALLHNVELNQFRNVMALPVAASDSCGTQDLLIAMFERSGHNTLGNFGYDTTALDHRQTVQTITLDSLVDENAFERVDLIKMDIEGAELAALKGARRLLSMYRPTLLLELSDRALKYQNATSQEIHSFLSGAGYVIYCFDPDSGLPAPLQARAYFDSENVLCVPQSTASCGTLPTYSG